MNNNTSKKLRTAEKNWHNTIGEYVLRYAGIFLALLVIIIGIVYGFKSEKSTPKPGDGYLIKHDQARTEKTVVFVTLNSEEKYNNEADVLKEAISSYQGVKIVSLNKNYGKQQVQNKNQIVFVLGSTNIKDMPGLHNLMKKVADRNVPLYWLGGGFSKIAHIFNIPFSKDEAHQEELSLTPPMSYITYKKTEINAAGLPFVRSNLKKLSIQGEVLARLKLHSTFSRAAIVRFDNIIYSAFKPFSRSHAPFALSLIMDSLSLLIGKHKPDPRVIFRLEDINGNAYNQNDSSFNKTVNYLVSEGVFVHLGIIPTTVDANDKVIANIDAAKPVLEFIKKYSQHTGIVQHGYKHFRVDPRNKGMGTGDAFEFFLDDDQTMGQREAGKFARRVIKQGYAIMLDNGMKPNIFEAPHYIMSPAQTRVAEEMFSLMQHEPLFYKEEPYGFFLPWFTQRNNTVYAPSSSGYVDSTKPDSVKNILYSLEQAAAILPDPVVVVFFHPFMREYKGREKDLEKLIQGIKDLNYKFVNMMEEVRSVATTQ